MTGRYQFLNTSILIKVPPHSPLPIFFRTRSLRKRLKSIESGVKIRPPPPPPEVREVLILIHWYIKKHWIFYKNDIKKRKHYLKRQKHQQQPWPKQHYRRQHKSENHFDKIEEQQKMHPLHWRYHLIHEQWTHIFINKHIKKKSKGGVHFRIFRAKISPPPLWELFFKWV